MRSGDSSSNRKLPIIAIIAIAVVLIVIFATKGTSVFVAGHGNTIEIGNTTTIHNDINAKDVNMSNGDQNVIINK